MSVWDPGGDVRYDTYDPAKLYPSNPRDLQQTATASDPTADINRIYNEYAKRNANPDELPSEIENWGKYGEAGLRDVLSKRFPAQQAQASTSQYSSSNAPAVSPFTTNLREILMQQLGALGQAPTVNDPGIAENLAGRRLALQRSAERQRAATAESLAGSGLASSGAAQTGRLGIEQARGEAEARGVGDVLGHELDSRRQQLAALLNMALQSGDAESARAIQQQIANDQLAYQYTGLQQNNNLQALLAILNAA